MSDADAAVLAELRRRIQGSFSPGELRGLGASLGLAPSDAWDRGGDATARDIVRRAVESPGLEALIEQLRRDRPLVEWADLLPPARGGDTAVDDVGARPTPVAPPPALELAPPPSSPAGPEAPTSAAAPAAAPPGWPMANLDAAAAGAAPRRGVDPRLFAITAACIALAVGLAFAGGMVFSRRGAPDDEAPAAARTQGLAGRAADAIDAALVEVARGCGIPPPEVPGREVLRAAQMQCGHPVAASGRPASGIDPHTIEPPELDVPPEGRLRPAPGAGRPAKTPAPPRDLCRAGCTAEHRSCKGACGNEPRDASDYAGWQSCQSKCLADESRCRSTCK